MSMKPLTDGSNKRVRDSAASWRPLDGAQAKIAHANSELVRKGKLTVWR